MKTYDINRAVVCVDAIEVLNMTRRLREQLAAALEQAQAADASNRLRRARQWLVIGPALGAAADIEHNDRSPAHNGDT